MVKIETLLTEEDLVGIPGITKRAGYESLCFDISLLET